jgi:hypothetical protein
MIFHRRGAEFAQRKAENCLLICASQRKSPRLLALKTLTGASEFNAKADESGAADFDKRLGYMVHSVCCRNAGIRENARRTSLTRNWFNWFEC